MAYELKMEGYEQNLKDVMNPDIWGKATYTFEFPNGYGARVTVCETTRFRTLWSLTGLRANKHGDLRILWYIPGVTDDIEMHLTDDDVRELLGMIKGL